MISYLIAGISLGLSAGFSPGPLFAMVISQTLRYGLREGIKAAFSPILTDLPIVMIITFLLSSIYAYKPLLGIISIVGGFFVTYLAYENFKIYEIKQAEETAEPNSVIRGAVTNALNPHPYLFWIMVGSPMIIKGYMINAIYAVIFIISFYICLIGAKVSLAVVVSKSREFLVGKAYFYTMKVLGVLLLIFALFLFHEGFLLVKTWF